MVFPNIPLRLEAKIDVDPSTGTRAQTHTSYE